MSNVSLNVYLDLKAPGAFLSTYKFILGKKRPNRNRSLVSTTKRLVNEYMAAQHDLCMALEVNARSISSWIKKRAAVKALKKRLSHIKQRLIHWVSTTVDFFKL